MYIHISGHDFLFFYVLPGVILPPSPEQLIQLNSCCRIEPLHTISNSNDQDSQQLTGNSLSSRDIKGFCFSQSPNKAACCKFVIPSCLRWFHQWVNMHHVSWWSHGILLVNSKWEVRKSFLWILWNITCYSFYFHVHHKMPHLLINNELNWKQR